MQRSYFSIILVIVLISSCLAADELKFCGVEWPPFTFAKQDTIVRGISFDVYQEAFERMGLKFTAKVLPWERCKAAVKQGTQFDAMIDNAALNPFIFGKYPTGVYPLVMFVREHYEASRFSWQNITGKRVGMVRGYDYTERVLQFDGWIRDFATTDEQMISKLLLNRYDYILGDIFSTPIIAQKLGVNLKMLTPSVDATYTFLVFHESKSAVLEQYDTTIKQMILDGTMESIYQKYGYSYDILMKLGRANSHNSN
ncbi:substrate-binding periplasmic protein [Thalassotalea fusca]